MEAVADLPDHEAPFQVSPPEISIIIPVLNEQDSVSELHREVVASLDGIGRRYEIIFVDDGSDDATPERLASLVDSSTTTSTITLRRRFGKTAALVAGFAACRGEMVITLDGDLQDDPAEIPRFVESLEAGNDLVVGWKKERLDPRGKTVPSRVFNGVVRRASGIELHDFNCGFKGYRRAVLEDLRLYGDMHRFIPVLAAWKGYKVSELAVHHRERRFGKSKFGAGRMISGMFDFVRVLFLTRYMQKPLQLFGGMGILLFLAGCGCGTYLAVLKFAYGQSIGVAHLPMLLLTVLLIVFGALLFAIGLIGEMLRHIGYRAVDEYSVKERRGPRSS